MSPAIRYDGTFVNTTNGCSQYESGCGLMQLYDVGMTSMFVQEAFALAELAQLIGEPKALSDMLTKRGTDMADKISAHLWNEELGIFVNRFSADHNNGSFYPHISPTSFYALQAKAATDTQASRMAEGWLTNKSHFCVAPNGDYQGNDDTCYWVSAVFSRACLLKTKPQGLVGSIDAKGNAVFWQICLSILTTTECLAASRASHRSRPRTQHFLRWATGVATFGGRRRSSRTGACRITTTSLPFALAARRCASSSLV